MTTLFIFYFLIEVVICTNGKSKTYVRYFFYLVHMHFLMVLGDKDLLFRSVLLSNHNNAKNLENQVESGTINPCCQVPSLNYIMSADVRDEYKGYPSKRLTTNVLTTVMTSTAFHCTTWCSMTDGCLAVNVIGDQYITCELTTGLSNKNEMEDDSLSQLFVAGTMKVFTKFCVCIFCIEKKYFASIIFHPLYCLL